MGLRQLRTDINITGAMQVVCLMLEKILMA